MENVLAWTENFSNKTELITYISKRKTDNLSLDPPVTMSLFHCTTSTPPPCPYLHPGIASPQGGFSGFQVTVGSKDFLGFSFLIPVFFLGRNIWHIFFGWLDLSRNFLAYYKHF